MAQASNQIGGIEIFTEASGAETIKQIQERVNTFLAGDGTIDKPPKRMTFPPQVAYDSTNDLVHVIISYALLAYGLED